MVDIAAKKLLSLFFDSVWFVKPSKAKSLEPVVQAWCKTKKKTVDSKEWERMLAEVNKYLKDTYPSAFDGDRSPHVFRYKDGQVEITKKWRKVIEQSYEKKLANYFLREREIHFTQGLDVDLDESLSRVSVPTLASPRTPPTLSLPTATTSTPVRASSALPAAVTRVVSGALEGRATSDWDAVEFAEDGRQQELGYLRLSCGDKLFVSTGPVGGHCENSSQEYYFGISFTGSGWFPTWCFQAMSS
ncbi:unnamed protein product [Polarella glacialis]|uniref:Uncharacterized protein n=1 Tax=Polarella glacialis TaxID=89957 RepID=A0A813M822_POLGL|nr:unnamed protein product [Polarella glacialis]